MTKSNPIPSPIASAVSMLRHFTVLVLLGFLAAGSIQAEAAPPPIDKLSKALQEELTASGGTRALIVLKLDPMPPGLSTAAHGRRAQCVCLGASCCIGPIRRAGHGTMGRAEARLPARIPGSAGGVLRLV